MTFLHYLSDLIRAHVVRYFHPEAVSLLARVPVSFVPYAEATAACGARIVIPTDIPTSTSPAAAYRVPFNGTDLTLWNPLPAPERWQAIPADTPLWYRHESGTLMPAWNLYGNCRDLLTLQEERAQTGRDHHGRFTGAMSPRSALGLLEVPAVNEAIAALVGAVAGLAAGEGPRFDLDGLLAPPVLVLSHDNDLLLGNDAWTQAVRLYRVVAPLRRGKPPHLANLWWVIRNGVRPRDYYFDNVLGMIDVERMLGYTSTFYFLNGTGGRFGSRNGEPPISALLPHVPDAWPVGMHYNYDTSLNAEAFAKQKAALERLTGQAMTTGRAHYLRLDPERSFSFWAEQGIRCDESLGYPDRIGYRAGMAGAFQVYDPIRQQPLDLWEVPLVVMDGTLLEQYPEDPAAAFERLMAHLAKIGGAMTLLVHPGVFFNPEFPESRGLYRKLLGIAHAYGAVGSPATSLIPARSDSHQLTQRVPQAEWAATGR